MCNITSVWYLVNAISRPRKQRISGFLSVLIWLWVCFAKRAMFWCEFRWVLSLLYPLRFADILQKNFFKNFFRSYFYSFFLYLLLNQIKQILLRIYLEYLGKTNKPTKRNKKKLIRFISPALPRGLPHSSLFICVFFFFFYLTQSKEGKSLNFLSLLNDVIFSRAHSDLNHKIKVPITTTGRSLLINAKKFRITYLNQMESWVHRKIVFFLHHTIRCIMVHRKIIKTLCSN